MMRSKSVPNANNQKPLVPRQNAHFKRPSLRAGSEDSDIVLPGSPRRIRHKHNSSGGNDVSNDKKQSKTRAGDIGIKGDVKKVDYHGAKCSHGFTKRKTSDEVFVTSKPMLPEKAVASALRPERKRSTGFGHPASVEKIFIDIPDTSSDEDEDSDDDNVSLSQKLDETADDEAREKETQVLVGKYKKICNLENVIPCGRFKRQLSSPVVDMSSSQLGTKDIKTICVLMATNIHIKDLDLSGNNLCGKGAKYVAEALRENTSVEDLTLAQCNLDLDGLKEIADLFLDMKPMKRLDMSNNKFSVKHAEVIANVIQKNDYIEEFSLSGNEFDEQGGVLIGQALVKNVGLKKLDLSWNHIRRNGGAAVCMALKHNTTLEELDLSWNGLAEEGCKALGVALPHNHTLRDLDISCNRINIFSLKEFLKGLGLNDTLHVLRIDQNPLTTDGAIGLMQCLTQSTCSQITDIHMIDIPINDDFLETLDELLKIHNVRVYHRDPNRKKITPIIRERTLKDYDPAMILFEYMKQENLRLIDLFRTFDTDGDQSVSKEELREGFVTINMPLSDDALETLFEKLDVNENEQIEYEEYKIGYRKAMKKMRSGLKSDDHHDVAAVSQLKGLVKKALRDKREEAARDFRRRRPRKVSLTAVFAVAGDSLKQHTWRNF